MLSQDRARLHIDQAHINAQRLRPHRSRRVARCLRMRREAGVIHVHQHNLSNAQQFPNPHRRVRRRAVAVLEILFFYDLVDTCTVDHSKTWLVSKFLRQFISYPALRQRIQRTRTR